MKKAIILTAAHGIGFKIADLSSHFNINSMIKVINVPGVGEVSGALPNHEYNNFTESFDYLIWSTGVFLQKPLVDTTDYEIDTLIDVHYKMPLKALRDLHTIQTKPYHLIVIASCSSWRLRNNEAIYCGLSAAKATFTRNFANDLTSQLPGSKVTLINPGGLRTPFFYEEESIDNAGYLDQEHLAQFILESATTQEVSYQEVQYLRNKSQTSTSKDPIIEYKTKSPEIII